MLELQDYEIDQVGGGWGTIARGAWALLGHASRIGFVVEVAQAIADGAEDHPTNAYATAKIGTPLN